MTLEEKIDTFVLAQGNQVGAGAELAGILKEIVAAMPGPPGPPGPQGPKGDTGVSADYPITIYNGLDSDATDAALAAAQGKVLDGKIRQLGQEVDNVPGPNYTSGKALKSNGTIVDAEGWGYTDYIPYTQGNNVIWNYGGDNSTYVLRFYNSNKEIINDGYWAANGGSGTKTIQAVSISGYAPQGAYIRASFRLNNSSASVTIGSNVAWTPQVSEGGLKQKVGALEPTVQKNTADIDTIFGRISYSEGGNIEWEITGKYIDQNGGVVSYSNYGISSQFDLTAGDKLYFTMKSSDTAYLCSVNNGVYTPIMFGYLNGEKSYVAENNISVVLCGDMTVSATYGIKRVSDPLITEDYLKAALDAAVGRSFVLLNPYAGVSYDNPICAQSHEHCYDKERLESAYNRGVRIIACSHYAPSTPRFPLSSYNVPYQDYKSKQAVLDGDLELVTRYTVGSIPVLNTESGNIDTDTIPQIANAEHPFVRGDAYGQHMNVLGLLWGEPGHSLCNNEVRENTAENNQIKSDYSLASLTKFNELLQSDENWQFGSRYAFGTVNHCTQANKVVAILDACPSIFKAMELFNQGYSEGWNQDFRDAYDAVLKTGKRIWGTAVVDWQGDWATWNFMTQEEQAEWTDKYNALSPAEQAEYESVQNYYLQTGRYMFDRGTNVLLMDASFNGLSASDKAKEAIKAYIGGRYYMSGRNTKSLKIVTDNHLVTLKLSDFADKAYVVTANGRTEYTNTDTINYVAGANDKFVRFEAFWNDGEFVFSNPVWVELVN